MVDGANSAPLVSPPPSTTSPQEDKTFDGLSQSQQWQRRNLHDTAALLSRDVAQHWHDKNYLFYLMDVKTCIGTRGCEHQMQHSQETSEDPKTPSDEQVDIGAGGHTNNDWYGAVAGHRSSACAKLERAEALDSLAGSQNPAVCILNVQPRSSSRLKSSAVHYTTAVQASVEESECVQEDADQSDDDDSDYPSDFDDSSEISDGSTEDDHEAEYNFGGEEEFIQRIRQMHEQIVIQAEARGNNCAISCAGYVPTQWLDFKPIWLRVRAHLLQAAPTILEAQETMFIHKMHWILHNVYHSSCVPGDLQDLFLDFLGLAPPSPTTPGCDKCVVVEGETQCSAREHSIERSAHWMLPRELWSSVLLDIRAFAGNTVSLVVLHVDGIKGQAIGVGGFDGPSSARFFFEAHLHESLVITGECDEDEDDDESAQGDVEVVESYLLTPSGLDATDRPSTAFSVKWAHA